MNNIPLKISQFKALLKEQGLSKVHIDEPLNKDLGEWFIDIDNAGEIYSISYQEPYGFGLYNKDAVYGEKPAQFILEAKSAVNSILKQLEPIEKRLYA
jgi:hypothetical protein